MIFKVRPRFRNSYFVLNCIALTKKYEIHTDIPDYEKN